MLVKNLIRVLTFLLTFAVGADVSLFFVQDKVEPVIVSEEIVYFDFPVTDSDTETTDPSEQDFSGWYKLEESLGMPDVNLILISRETDSETGKLNKLFSGGGVFTYYEDEGDQGFVETASFDIGLPSVSFRTKKIHGFDYRFKGVFYKNKTMGKEGEKLLRGTLEKFRNGKRVAVTSGDFAYYEPQCWH